MLIRLEQGVIPESNGMENGHLLVTSKTMIWAVLEFVVKIAVEYALAHQVALILHGTDTKVALVG